MCGVWESRIVRAQLAKPKKAEIPRRVNALLQIKDYFDRGRYWVNYGQGIIMIVVLINTSQRLSTLGNKAVVLAVFVFAYFATAIFIGYVEKKTKIKDMINRRRDQEQPELMRIAKTVNLIYKALKPLQASKEECCYWDPVNGCCETEEP